MASTVIKIVKSLDGEEEGYLSLDQDAAAALALEANGISISTTRK